MTSLLAIPLLLLGEFTLRVSPDREVPLSYTDEPLLLEIRGLEEGAYSISGTLEAATGESNLLSLNTQSFLADQPHYITVPHDESALGEHTLTLTINGEKAQAQYYRLLRPDPNPASPFRVTFNNWEPSRVESMMEIPLSEARLFADDPQLAEAVQQLRSYNIPIHLVVHQATAPASDAELELWVNDFGEYVAGWEFEVTENIDDLNRLIRVLRRTKPDAHISLRVESVEQLERYLLSDRRPYLSRVYVTRESTDQNELYPYRLAAELSGLETVEFSMDSLETNPVQTWKHLTQSLAPLRAIQFDVPGSEIRSVADLSRLSVYNTWSKLLSEFRPIGPYYIRDDVECILFRRHQNPGEWILALTAKEPVTLDIPKSIGTVSYFNGQVFSIDTTPLQQVDLDTSPTLLHGLDQNLVATALCNRLSLDANLLLAVESYASALSANALETLKTCKPGDSMRNAFFSLLRLLPELERQYQQSELEAHIAIPVIARLAGIARLICALEQESNHAFLEPAETTLRLCNEFLAQYLSNGIVGQRSDRDEQLLGEIRRLMDATTEAEQTNRPIEAAGIAILAEWRARSLLARSE